MEAWSDTVHDKFCIKVFLDTNILVYLLDSTFPNLDNFIRLLSGTPFAELVSSKYALFEFVSVRKREHHLRSVYNKLRENGEKINFSSLIKYRDDDKFVPFEEVKNAIKIGVNEEIEDIVTNFNINFEYSDFHEEQFYPAFDICLTSKIDSQDSMILVSSVLPVPGIKNDNVFLLTNDLAFSNAIQQLNTDSLNKDFPFKLPKLGYTPNITEVDLRLTVSRSEILNSEQLADKTNQLLLANLKEMNRDLFLGQTFSSHGENIPSNIICFKLIADKELLNDIHITIIDKNMNYIIHSKKKVGFWLNGKKAPLGFRRTEEDNRFNISFKLTDCDEDGNETAIEQEIIDIIKQEGNLIFIHPDSLK